MILESYSFLEALYMTIITVSTVGFTEVKPLSDGGRVFTAVLILSNIGIFAYFISTMTTMIIDGELKSVIKSIRMQREISKLKDHIIVCGFGRLGKQIVEELHNEGKEFVIIESNPQIIEEFEGDKPFRVVEGDATDEDHLIQLNVEQAKTLITTLPKDADNVYVVLSAIQLNKDINIISRASNRSSQQKLKHAGATHVIMPEHVGGLHMAQLVTKPNLVEFLNEVSHRGVNIYFEECTVDNLAQKEVKRTLGELDVRNQTGAYIVALRKDNGDFIINPQDSESLTLDSKLIILGDESQIQSFKELLKN
ncbi:MAG: potassium channel protein [Chitinophagales bacterium]|nr:potassium channel protein [Chitinophagales bacterium]